MINRFSIIFLLFIFSSSIFAAQDRYGVWTNLSYRDNFRNSEVWLYQVSMETRFSDNPGAVRQANIFGALGYAMSQKWQFWVGYSWFPSFNNQQVLTNENRIWEQLGWRQQYKPITFALRERLEQRFRSFQPGYSLRLRNRFDVIFTALTFHNITPEAYDELYVLLNHPVWVTNQTIDQNRIFAGVSFPLRQDFRFRIGYLNIYRPWSQTLRIQNILYVSVYH